MVHIWPHLTLHFFR